jgi:hypothetical protein
MAGEINWLKAEAEVKKKAEAMDEMLGAWCSANPDMLVDFGVENYPPRISLTVAVRSRDGRRAESFELFDTEMSIRARTMSAAECEVAGQLAADLHTLLDLRVFREIDAGDCCRYTFKPIYHEVRAGA